MTEPKKPATKKADPPAEAPEPSGVQVKVGDRSWFVSDAARNDFELMGDLFNLDETDSPVYLPPILRRILGDEQYAEAMQSLRDPETNRVSVDAGRDLVFALLKGVNPN